MSRFIVAYPNDRDCDYADRFIRLGPTVWLRDCEIHIDNGIYSREYPREYAVVLLETPQDMTVEQVKEALDLIGEDENAAIWVFAT